MRIAQVCPYSLSVPGGVQRQVLGLARAQRALGHQVTVLAPSDGPPPEPGVCTVGPSVPFVSNGSVAPIGFGAGCVLRTLAALREERFDVLHLHEPLVPGPALVSLVAQGLVAQGAPAVGTFHRSGPSRAYRLLRPAVRALAGRLALRCAVSADARATAEEALGGRYDLLPNGIELDRFAKATPWPSHGPTVIFVGRHEPRKGLHVLLEAFAAIEVRATLWVVGSGPETVALRRRYEHLAGVEWLGVLSEEEKTSRLLGADVLCAPSLHGESFGVVLLEGMAAGLAIVAADLPAYRRVARTGRDALLVPPGDARALAGALQLVLSDPGEAQRMASGGRDTVEAYSMESLADAYLDRYRLLTAG